jgi:GntR family transcriptional regulator
VADLTRTTYDSTGRPVEVMLAVIAGDMVVFDDRFPIPD